MAEAMRLMDEEGFSSTKAHEKTGIPSGTLREHYRDFRKAKTAVAVVVPRAPEAASEPMEGVVRPDYRSLDQWAEYLLEAKAEVHQWYVELGHRLIEAKAGVEHGDWMPLLKKVGIGADNAERYMRIARHEVLANSAYVQIMPSAMTPNYELTKLEPDQLETAIEAGAIHHEMTLSDAKKVVQIYGGGGNAKASEKPKSSGKGLTQWLQSVPTDKDVANHVLRYGHDSEHMNRVREGLAEVRAFVEVLEGALDKLDAAGETPD
jgi:hypothetical protein